MQHITDLANIDPTETEDPDPLPSLYGDPFLGLYGLIYAIRWDRAVFILLACIAWAGLLGAAYLWGAK